MNQCGKLHTPSILNIFWTRMANSGRERPSSPSQQVSRLLNAHLQWFIFLVYLVLWRPWYEQHSYLSPFCFLHVCWLFSFSLRLSITNVISILGYQKLMLWVSSQPELPQSISIWWPKNKTQRMFQIFELNCIQDYNSCGKIKIQFLSAFFFKQFIF